MASLMALCARAERSSGDARRLMTQWGIEPSDQESILQRLRSERFIDDERYASAYVREKCNLSGWGGYKIRAALQRKGIAKEIIDDKLSALDPEAMQDRLDSALRRKMGRIKFENNYQLRDKLLRYGASLGYTFEQLNDAINSIVNLQNEEF